MWEAKTRDELVIEVWEKLDCESIGRTEIEAIEAVVRDVYGDAAVESPMKIARLLADEGAELRHSEIMELFIQRYEERPYTAEFRNILKTDSLARAERSIRDLENLRRKFASDGDRNGQRLISERAIAAKRSLGASGSDAEIAQWLTIWLENPEAFDSWLALRKRSPDFKEKFGGDE